MRVVESGVTGTRTSGRPSATLRRAATAVRQHGAVVAILSAAVSEGALGPKLTEGVSGSRSGHDRRSVNFRVPGRPSAHSAWRQWEGATHAHNTRMMIGRVHCVPEMGGRALERRRGGPVWFEWSGISVGGSRSDFRPPRMYDIIRSHRMWPKT
jgi:hypothetical protein